MRPPYTPPPSVLWYDPDLPRRIQRRARLQLIAELAILAGGAIFGLICGFVL